MTCCCVLREGKVRQPSQQHPERRELLTLFDIQKSLHQVIEAERAERYAHEQRATMDVVNGQ